MSQSDSKRNCIFSPNKKKRRNGIQNETKPSEKKGLALSCFLYRNQDHMTLLQNSSGRTS